MNNKIRIGGVPEHFNLPIRLAMENGSFAERGLDITWTDFPGGTGQMNQALREDQIDVCIILTEGVINDIIKGNPSKIISNYVITPLTWGIHTGAANSLSHYEDIFDKKYAISRFGSGSHLMSIVDANTKNKNLKKDQFVVINDIYGALDSLSKNETDVFYWEKFTTKPYVDEGKLKRIGEYKTPWPCFVVAATNRILADQKDNVIRMLRTIHDSCDRFMQDKSAIEKVSERYGLQIHDVERWYHSTEWAIHGWVSNKMIESTIFYLQQADIVKPDESIPDLIWTREN